MRTKVVNKNKEPYDVYIGRGSIYGNPFTHKELSKTKALVKCKSVKEAVSFYKWWVLGLTKLDGINPPTLEQIRELKGKTLGCYCDQDKPCHGQVLAELAEATDEEIKEMRFMYKAARATITRNIF